MKKLKELKRRLALKRFHKRAQKVKFPHNFIDIEKAKVVGAIFNVTESTSKDLIIVTDFLTKLEDSGKKIFLVEMNFKRNAEPMFNETNKTVFVSRKNINWLNLPSREILQEINKNQFDILLDLDTTEYMTARFICGLSNAKTRVGIFEEGFNTFYELMLDTPKDIRLKALLHEYEIYLKMIEK